MRSIKIKLLNLFFGKVHFRVKFSYKINGAVVFDYTDSVTLDFPSLINDHRKLKIASGAIHIKLPEVRHLLNNGRLNVEPICYLGRW